MSAVLLDDVWHVARREHVCDACLGTIGRGDRYRRQRLIGDEPYTFKCHALCDAIYWHQYRALGLWDDETLDPFEEIRPALADVFAFVCSLFALPAAVLPEETNP